MSKTIQITSPAEFASLVSSSAIVVADFYADWCGPCKTIAPMYEELSARLSRPNKITFVKVNVDNQQQIAQTYGITAMPTFKVFKNGNVVSTVQGADPRKLSEAVKKLAAEAESTGPSTGGFGESSGSGKSWLGASLPRGYRDVTDEVDLKGLDILNSDSEFAGVRTLFDLSKPSSVAAADSKGKGKSEGGQQQRDWVESDTDEQLMLFMPFQSTLKVHSLHLTSLPGEPSDDSEAEDELPMRPKTIRLYTNPSHVLGFEEAEDITPTQSITLSPEDWDDKTGTAKLELRFVKFQNVSSIVLFIVDGDGDGDGERVRLDRVRIIGETGEKRDPGKLEKIGDEVGE
ncbi:thioredoxin [Xylona heveae TC161]|uniref:Thioredoxin n=1 Tax=Xylona heveae (strain CBS 132557 / TC161) TaxID=1328760 RepID=A0A165IEI5_XYLHT|nr:thioredoxin [Xylona heveae TC161]KZF24781.1 thioredoxin [Xylona heveae TC161]